MKDSTECVVDFLGYEITLIHDEDGNEYVPLKRLCEILGIDHRKAMNKVKGEDIFSGRVLYVTGKDCRQRKMYCLPLKKMYFWLFRVDPNTVRPEIIERLLEYRDESRMALRHYEQYGISINPRLPAEQIEEAVRESLDRLMDKSLSHRGYPKQRRYELLLIEVGLLSQFENEAPPFRDKANECIEVAIDRFYEWLVEHDESMSCATIH